jgi:hypothetical protein
LRKSLLDGSTCQDHGAYLGVQMGAIGPAATAFGFGVYVGFQSNDSRNVLFVTSKVTQARIGLFVVENFPSTSTFRLSLPRRVYLTIGSSMSLQPPDTNGQRKWQSVHQYPKCGHSGLSRRIRYKGHLHRNWSDVLALALYGLSYAEMVRELMQIRRQAVLQHQPASIPIRRTVLEKIRHLDRQGRTSFALKLSEAG